MDLTIVKDTTEPPPEENSEVFDNIADVSVVVISIPAHHICHQDANALMLGEFPVVMDLVGSVEAAKAAKQQVFTETASMSAISMRISVSKSIISISYARPQSR